MSARDWAVDTLVSVLAENGFASLSVSETLKKHAEAMEEEKAFYTSLVYTTLEHLETIDAILSARLSKGIRTLKPYVACVLRISVTQLKYMEKIPASAAIHSAVEMVKKSRFSGLSGLTNAVLRGCVRSDFEYVLPDETTDWAGAMSLKYEMPRELCVFFNSEEMLKRFQNHSETCLRVNLLKTDLDSIAQEVGSFATLDANSLHPETACLYLSTAAGLSTRPGFKEGRYTVQDEASVLSALCLRARPGESVWDMCAAPGSKTMVIAETMQNQGCILATDLYESRVRLIKENAERMGVKIVTTEAVDATTYQPKEPFDRVLLDAPCSGLGLLGSKPDLKYHKPLSRFEELVPLQAKLLDNAAKTLKKSGVLVYSTCTLNPAENEGQIEKFLQRHPEMEALKVWDLLPKAALNDTIENQTMGCLTLKPIPHGRDGFFISALKKKD